MNVWTNIDVGSLCILLVFLPAHKVHHLGYHLGDTFQIFGGSLSCP